MKILYHAKLYINRLTFLASSVFAYDPPRWDGAHGCPISMVWFTKEVIAATCLREFSFFYILEVSFPYAA